MKGFHFYLEYASKRDKNRATRKNPGKHTGNVLALNWPVHAYVYDGAARSDAIAAVFYERDSAVCGISVDLDYVEGYCLRISEKQAREIHPELFKRLDMPD